MTQEKKGFFQNLFSKKEAGEQDQASAGNGSANGENSDNGFERKVLEITPAVIDNARLTLIELLKAMHLDVDVVTKDDLLEGINFEIIGNEDLGLVIGKDGNTLSALQFLLSRILSKKYGQKVYVHLDANAYKEKKMNAIIAAAEDAADVVEKEGVQIALDPMNSSERRIVHMTLKKREAIETFSRGEGSLRHIVVAKKGSNPLPA